MGGRAVAGGQPSYTRRPPLPRPACFIIYALWEDRRHSTRHSLDPVSDGRDNAHVTLAEQVLHTVVIGRLYRDR